MRSLIQWHSWICNTYLISILAVSREYFANHILNRNFYWICCIFFVCIFFIFWVRISKKMQVNNFSYSPHKNCAKTTRMENCIRLYEKVLIWKNVFINATQMRWTRWDVWRLASEDEDEKNLVSKWNMIFHYEVNIVGKWEMKDREEDISPFIMHIVLIVSSNVCVNEATFLVCRIHQGLLCERCFVLMCE